MLSVKQIRAQIASHQRWLRNNPMCAGQTMPTNYHAAKAKAEIALLEVRAPRSKP